MTRLFDFSLERQGLEGVRFLICRDALPSNGDLESAFLDGLTNLRRHPACTSVSTVLFELAETSRHVVVIRNPQLVLDRDLPGRIAKAITSLDAAGDWALAGAGGLGLNDRRHIALYASAHPAIPEHAGLQPLIDLMPDLYVVDSGFVRGLPVDMLTRTDTALELALVVRGYLDGRVSVFAPDLTAAIDGDLLARDFERLTSEMACVFADLLGGQTIGSLAGPICLEANGNSGEALSQKQDLGEVITQCVVASSDAPMLTIVTRTRFDRPHLLGRMLTSISRARSAMVPVEVVLSSDSEPAIAEAAFRDLQRAFINLTLRLELNPPGGHSRVTNLLGGVHAATGEYVLILDDDDYLDLFAFDNLLPAFFSGNRPLVALTAEVHEETWEATPSGRWVLTHSVPMTSYPASGWRRMFSGVNKLPICGLAIPRERLLARLKAFEFKHDLSEDYALFLLLLTDQELPDVHEVADPVTHISIRDSENSVLMHDRRPWAHDIMQFLSDLTQKQGIAGPGQWALHAESGRNWPSVTDFAALTELQSLLRKRDQEIRLLRRELGELRRYAPAETETAA